MLRGGSLALAVATVVSGLMLGGCGDYGLDFTRRGPGAEKAKRKPELWTMFEIRSAIGEGLSGGAHAELSLRFARFVLERSAQRALHLEDQRGVFRG